MSIFAVTYSYGGPTETLNEHRPAHRAYLGGLAQQGKIMGSGPFTDQGAAGALLVFSAESAEEVRAILAEDPLVIQGVVTGHSVREWSINTGTWS